MNPKGYELRIVRKIRIAFVLVAVLVVVIVSVLLVWRFGINIGQFTIHW